MTLDRGGRVTGAGALSGAPLLAPAALAHARTWRVASYRRLPRQIVVVYEFGRDDQAAQVDAFTARMGIVWRDERQKASSSKPRAP